MRYTIIGGEGLIARHLVKHLSNMECNVECLPKNQLPSIEKNYGVIIYCAGVKSDFEHKLFDLVEAHVCYLACFLKNATFEHFIYLSSTRLYSKTKIGLEDNKIFKVDNTDVYNLSKLLGEAVCLMCKKSITIVRLSNVLCKEAMDGFFHVILNQAIATNEINISESKTMARDYIIMEELIQALVLVCNKKINGIFNFASGCFIKNSEIVSLIQQYIPIKRVSYGRKRIKFPDISTQKTLDELSFKFTNPREYMKNIIKDKLAEGIII